MRIRLRFEYGSAVNSVFHLREYSVDVEQSERMKNLNTSIKQRLEQKLPGETAHELRRMIENLCSEAATIGCLTGFDFCAEKVNEAARVRHSKGDFSDRRGNSYGTARKV